MNRKILFLIVFSFFVVFASKNTSCVFSAENNEYQTALEMISQGRRSEGEAMLKRFLASNPPQQEKQKAAYDLVSMLAEEGRNKEVLSAVAEYGLPENAFFAQFEKGWSLLSLNKNEEARKAFYKSKAMTANQSYLSQADFAIAIAEARSKKTENALQTMATVYTKYAPLLSASSYVIGKLLISRKEYEKADFFMGNSLQFDSNNFQAEADYANLNEKRKAYTTAWQAWRTLQEMDPSEKRFDVKIKKLAKKVQGEKDNLMFWQRMDWPVHNSLRKVYGGEEISVSLYASPKGESSALLEFSFMGTSDFEIEDDKLGHLMSGKKLTPWKIVFNKEEQMMEIHDSLGASARSTYGNIKIKSKSGGAVILIKDPLFSDENVRGINRGDKETGGELDVDITPEGMTLKAVIDEESLACPITAAAAGRTYELQFAKAAAIAVRTKLREYKNNPRHSDADMCDSAHCLEFAGMQAENAIGTEAVEQTYGQVLMTEDLKKIWPVSWIRACAGIGRMCQPEHENPADMHINALSPFELYMSFVAAPSDSINCLPESRLNYVELNWTLLLSPYWIESRANRISKIGRIKAIYPLKRSPDGRVLALRAEGFKNHLDIEGEKEISEFLAAGSLRSPLFVIRPVYNGKYPEFFIVRGRGTFPSGQKTEGSLCLRGAEGMSARQEADSNMILKHYFPGAVIHPEQPGELPRQETVENAPAPEIPASSGKGILDGIFVKTGN